MDDSTYTLDGGSISEPEQPVAWGPFRLIERVGQGGFGEVYRAWDPTLEREVALKLLRRRSSEDADTKAILREARSLARVRHPNVVPVYGVDRHDGRVGFWSDFVKGKTLATLLTEHGPYGAQEATAIGIELARALSAVHAAGLLHRDIKSGNVMREEGGRILLMDFGLTHESGSGPGFAGTPAYMAPELWEGRPATQGTDVYALGILLFHLVTGKYPTDSEQLRSDPKAAFQPGSRRSLVTERPDLPETFVRVVETAIDPQKRYATAGELFTALVDSAGPGGPRNTSESSAPARSRSRIWITAAAIAGTAAVLLFLTPARTLLPWHAATQTTSGGAQNDYLQAQDLLEHYYKPNNLDNAVALFQKATNEDPKFALAFAGLGRAEWYLYRSARKTELIEPARQACEHAIELDPEQASAHITLGMIYTQSGKKDLASAELQKAIKLDARNADAYGALADLYTAQGRDSEVLPTLQKAVDLSPAQWRWVNQLGLYYMSKGKLDDAAAQFMEATKVNGDNARAWGNLGMTYGRQYRLAEAQAAYERSLELEPLPNNMANLGTILEMQGDYAKAAATYQRAIDKDPASYVSWGNLASAYENAAGQEANSRKAYDRAIELAEETRKRQPNDARVLADLGHYYARTGTADKALPLLRQAVAVAPSDPQVLYLVAEGYESLHRRKDALAWLRKSLDNGFSKDILNRSRELAGVRADPAFQQK